MPREIDLSLLRAFLAVAQTGNMTVAGRHLHLTQAAVSQQIKRLEEQFGGALFDRGQRRLKLTPSGERLVGHAERLLSQNDELWSLMTSSEFEGQVSLGIPHDVVGAFMPPILRSFSRSWPRVDIRLVCATSAELLHALDQGEIDLTLTTEPAPAPQAELLLADKLVWVGGPDGDAHTRTPLPVSFGDEHCAFRAAASRALTATGRDWRFACIISNIDAMCATLEADLAVAPLLSQTVPENLRVLDGECGLPPLPTFYVNLHRAPAGAGAIATELANQIVQSFAARYPKAA